MLELVHSISYPNYMLKRFSYFFACVLLVLMPLQGFAAANMSICNSMMQAQSIAPKSASMPCHKHMASTVSVAKSQQTAQHTAPCKTACKTFCATLCASMGAIAALPSDIKPAAFLASSALISLPNQAYASITQPNLQRPPIVLS
jgi:hypothetical protein